MQDVLVSQNHLISFTNSVARFKCHSEIRLGNDCTKEYIQLQQYSSSLKCLKAINHFTEINHSRCTSHCRAVKSDIKIN